MGKKLIFNDIKKFIEIDSKSNCILLSDEYINTKELLKIKCACGEIFRTNWDNFKHSNKRSCSYCSNNRVRNKICPSCNLQFKPIKKKQICCSKSCGNKLRNPNIFIKCNICNSKNHYCSNECRSIGVGLNNIGKNNPNYRGKSYLGNCDYCNKEYIVNEYGNRINKYNYCSQLCKGEHQKETLLKDLNPRYLSVECRCDFCEKKLLKTPSYLEGRKNIFCSKECYADWQSINKTGKNNHNFNTLKTDEERELGRHFEGYLYWRREVYKRDNYVCQCCGYSKGGNLNAHHLDGYNWAKDKRTDINNGITLCNICHKKFHDEYGYNNSKKEQFNKWLKENTLIP